MLMDYWVAASYGRAWLALRRGLRLRPLGSDLPGLCSRVARGEQLTAGDLGKVQNFAVAMWMRSALIVIVAVVIIGVVGKAASTRNAAPSVVVVIVLASGLYAGLATLQAVMALCRAGLNGGYVRTSGPHASQQPLPPGSLGLPRRWDFWAVVVSGAAMFAVLAYAGLD
jgi:hypothetical protein